MAALGLFANLEHKFFANFEQFKIDGYFTNFKQATIDSYYPNFK